jgi:hypothetical protein
MKHPTDEQIEKWTRDYSDNMGDDPIEVSDLRQACTECAKWARDQQPKLKTLEWITMNPGFRAHTSFGIYIIMEIKKGGFYFDFHGELTFCNSIDDCKQLAQADYERRINELYI